MKRKLILVNDYPSNENLYANGFVHRRMKLYQDSSDIQFDVFVLIKKQNGLKHYNYDGVKVYVGTKDDLTSILYNTEYSKILVHFINRHMMSVLKKVNVPVIVWVHGSEALSWKRRLFNFNWKEPLSFIKYIFQNMRQLKKFKTFLINKKDNIELIFVSEWMKQIFETDLNVKLNFYGINSHIIPNLIDEKLFEYNKKEMQHRKKFLSIRPYTSKKYANDIVVEAIKILSSHEKFKQLEFKLVGDGPNFLTCTNPIKNLPNVILEKRFIPQKEIVNLHKEYGVYLCPTRQDSQGVSMCEAMSSGLVPISTVNTAIPEFVNKKTGILIERNSSELLAAAILEIAEKSKEFESMSFNAAQEIRKICSTNVTIEKELKLIKSELSS